MGYRSAWSSCLCLLVLSILSLCSSVFSDLTDTTTTTPIHHNKEHFRGHGHHQAHRLHHGTTIVADSTAASSSNTHQSPSTSTTAYRLPIVFVYTVVAASCPFGLPEYIRISIEQTIFTQPDCEVILLSNIGECAKIAESVRDVEGLRLIDSIPLSSERMRRFHNMSMTIFESQSSNGELWVTSALRFFMLEDLMISFKFKELLHIEADNMIYGRYTTLLPILRQSYPMTATPLNVHKSFITASILWISSLPIMISFNNYLLELGSNENKRWDGYLTWIKPYACCKRGGLYPDENGNGLRPFAINEMSMLAYYHELYPEEFKLLPVVPAYPYLLNRYVTNMSHFGPGGGQVGPATGHGIWDPNSWGQFIGGTSVKRGSDKGFTDASHIAGQAIRTNYCKVAMICGNMTEFGYAEQTEGATSTVVSNEKKRCYTAPFVRCGLEENQPWTPLWNLHVHSKHTQDYVSTVCDCATGEVHSKSRNRRFLRSSSSSNSGVFV